MNYIFDMYRQMFVSLKRGNCRGVFSNAKPIFLMSLIDYFSQGHKNMISFPLFDLENIYKSNCYKFDATCKSNIINPFFHLDSEPFYSLVWKIGFRPKFNAHTPSAKYLRENLEYAEIDKDLWELLQNEENRVLLKTSLIAEYFAKP